MADRFTVLHHGGNDLDNPILEDQTLTIVLHKQDDDQLLKKCFVVVDGEIHADLIRAAAGSGYYVDIPGYLRFRQFECPE